MKAEEQKKNEETRETERFIGLSDREKVAYLKINVMNPTVLNIMNNLIIIINLDFRPAVHKQY